jgi:PAS domain S-box-containing protein
MVLRSAIGMSPSNAVFLYVLALLISAWHGFGPGWLTLLLGVAVIPYLYRANFSPAKTDPYVVAELFAVSTATSSIAAMRRRTEETLLSANKQANAAVKRQLAELENLYNQLPVGLCFLDRDLRYVRINEKLAATQGGSVIGHIGQPLQKMIGPELATVIEPLCRRVLDTGSAVLYKEVTGRLSRTAHEKRDWMIDCCRVDTNDGTVLGVQMIIQEITERKRAERALSRANEDLQQFAYLAAHDLQEPLRIVVNFSQLAQRKSGHTLSHDTHDHLNRVVEAAKRMSRQIRDVLDYLQATGDTELPYQLVDVGKLLASVLMQMRERIEESHATINYSDLPTVEGDPTRLGQVFRNLIANAIQYRKEEVAPIIRVTARRQNEEWVFAVEDNGQGFQQAYAERVFGMFKRLHGQRVPGSGIGLTICKAVVERHGGRVWAQSQEGNGTTMYFTLPVHRHDRAIAVSNA